MFNIFGKKNKAVGMRNEELPLLHDGLPDSFRPNGLCPRCGKQSSFEILGELPVTFNGSFRSVGDNQPKPAQIDRVISMQCRHCNQCVIVVEEEWIGDKPVREGMSGGMVSYHGIHWWPYPEANLSSDVPEEIASAYSEAIKCIYAETPLAATIMLRKSLEAITKHFGETKGNLKSRLDRLAERNVLQPSLADWSNEVRLLGNQSAHDGGANSVELKDAKQLSEFIRELLKYLFELPADLERRRQGK